MRRQQTRFNITLASIWFRQNHEGRSCLGTSLWQSRASVVLPKPADCVLETAKQAYIRIESEPVIAIARGNFGGATLSLGDLICHASWTLAVARLAIPVLGYSGCLEYFLASFDGEAQVVELIPHKSFPSVD